MPREGLGWSPAGKFKGEPRGRRRCLKFFFGKFEKIPSLSLFPNFVNIFIIFRKASKTNKESRKSFVGWGKKMKVEKFAQIFEN